MATQLRHTHVEAATGADIDDTATATGQLLSAEDQAGRLAELTQHDSLSAAEAKELITAAQTEI